MRILLNGIWPQLGINEYIYQHKNSYSTILSPLILILVFTVLDQQKGTGGLGLSTRNQDYGGSPRQIQSFQVITLWTLIGITFNLVINVSVRLTILHLEGQIWLETNVKSKVRTSMMPLDTYPLVWHQPHNRFQNQTLMENWPPVGLGSCVWIIF